MAHKVLSCQRKYQTWEWLLTMIPKFKAFKSNFGCECYSLLLQILQGTKIFWNTTFPHVNLFHHQSCLKTKQKKKKQKINKFTSVLQNKKKKKKIRPKYDRNNITEQQHETIQVFSLFERMQPILFSRLARTKSHNTDHCYRASELITSRPMIINHNSNEIYTHFIPLVYTICFPHFPCNPLNNQWLPWTKLQMTPHNDIPQTISLSEGVCLSLIVASSLVWCHY